MGSLLLGTRRLFDFASHNPLIELAGIDRCNGPPTIAKIPRFISINSAIEVDHWGQVNAEAIGDAPVAGAGSQVDYSVGAWHAPDSFAVIALPSVTPSGRFYLRALSACSFSPYRSKRRPSTPITRLASSSLPKPMMKSSA
ncbi:acetyl-CoA hydrolase/transferase C-terminal domain-containing protein [Sorangium cellulosum]|uniref:acetyl-CoA hydrolase/transferase C-terminal domain-containing protein n=1 Tax=Sorangium cellulosum TaxID=56 RepID=UPI003D9A4A7D